MSVSEKVLVALRPALDAGEPRRLVLEATATVAEVLAAGRAVRVAAGPRSRRHSQGGAAP
jgi:hypothetical protein